MAKEKSPNDRHVAIKSNTLVEARYRLSLQETRVIYWLLTQIQPEDEDFKTHKMEIENFAKLIGVEADNQYSKLRSVTKSLMRRVMEIYSPEKKKTLQVSWLSSAEYQDMKGYISLEFSPKLKPYLLQLKSHFTKIDFADFLELRSVYSVRIFEILLQYESIGKRKVFIDDLRSYCGVGEGEYELYSDIKRRVIEHAKTEINAKTEYEVDYTEVKESRKVIAIEWTIKKKTHFEKVQQEKSSTIQKELRSGLALIEKIMEYGFTRQTAKKLVQKGTEQEVGDAIKSVDLQVSRGHVKNPKAMIKIAIEERWKSDVFVSRKKK
jgi:plasmid replication initiation protein